MKKVKEGYKMTELGEIPEKWYISKLSELAQIKRGASPRPINNTKWFSEKKNVGWIRISDVTKTKKYLNSTEQYLSDEGVAKSRLVRPNDLIMSICATVGKPIILNIDACIHDGFILFDDLNNNKIITDYLYYLLQKKEEEFKGMGQTGTQANLNTNIVGSTLIAIPTIEEQKKIALILSIVDEQIDNVDELIQKNKELKKGLMQKLLTKGIGHTKFKKTEIGEIPEEWEVKVLGELAQFIGSGVTPKGGENVYKDSGIPFIRSQNVYPNRLILENVAFIDEVQHEKMKRTEVVERDVLLNITGASIGRCTDVPVGFNKGNVNQHVCIIRLNEYANERFISTTINSPLVKKQIDSFNGGSSREGLNFQQVRAIKIGVPKIKEQLIIATIISEVDNKIEEYENKRQKLEELKKGLMQQMLTGKIRVC